MKAERRTHEIVPFPLRGSPSLKLERWVTKVCVCVCVRGRIDFAIKNCNSIRSEWSVISMSPYGVCVLCIIKAVCIRTISKPVPEAGLGRLVCLFSAALSTCKVQTRLRNSRRYEHFVNRCCYVGLIARTLVSITKTVALSVLYRKLPSLSNPVIVAWLLM